MVPFALFSATAKGPIGVFNPCRTREQSKLDRCIGIIGAPISIQIYCCLKIEALKVPLLLKLSNLDCSIFFNIPESSKFFVSALVHRVPVSCLHIIDVDLLENDPLHVSRVVFWASQPLFNGDCYHELRVLRVVRIPKLCVAYCRYNSWVFAR